jgi:hypothetical protein
VKEFLLVFIKHQVMPYVLHFVTEIHLILTELHQSRHYTKPSKLMTPLIGLMLACAQFLSQATGQHVNGIV